MFPLKTRAHLIRPVRPGGEIRRSLTAIKGVNPITSAELSSGRITSKLGVKLDKDKAGGAQMSDGGVFIKHTHAKDADA